MGDEIRYPALKERKYYMSGLDGRVIELGRPKDLTLTCTAIDRAIFDLDKTANWYEPIISDSAFALPERRIINTNACILFWKDGTKTIVKRSKDEKFDARLAFLTAYFQKHCGLSKTKANKYIKGLEVLN